MRLNKSKGTRRRHRVSHNKRGGYWGEVLKQAIVPLGLLTLQQTYNKNSYYNNHVKAARHTRKRGRRTFNKKH